MVKIIWFRWQKNHRVAAASYMAKLARLNGGFEVYSDRPIMRAQIQVMGVQDLHL